MLRSRLLFMWARSASSRAFSFSALRRSARLRFSRLCSQRLAEARGHRRGQKRRDEEKRQQGHVVLLVDGEGAQGLGEIVVEQHHADHRRAHAVPVAVGHRRAALHARR
jgi:hypothetical protein